MEWILLKRPMFLVFPKTPEECLVKKYAKERPLDIEDAPKIEGLNPQGYEIIRINYHEEVEIISRKEWIWQAHSTKRGIKLLRLGSLNESLDLLI